MSKLSRNLSTLYSKLCIRKRKSSFLLLMVARLVYWLHLFLSQAKRNPRAADPPVDNSKNPHFLVLISENFMEARAALSRPGVANLAPNQNPVKMDIAPVTSVTGPAPTSIPSGFLYNDSALFLCNVFVMLTFECDQVFARSISFITSLLHWNHHPPHKKMATWLCICEQEKEKITHASITFHLLPITWKPSTFCIVLSNPKYGNGMLLKCSFQMRRSHIAKLYSCMALGHVCFLYYSMLTPIWKILALKLLSCFSFRNFSRDPIFVRFKHFFCLSNNIIGCWCIDYFFF